MKNSNLRIALFLTMAFPLAVHAQSFDCSKATTAVEHAICGDGTLRDLDIELTDSYKKARSDTSDITLVKAQKQWLSRRNQRCGKLGAAELTQCLVDSYQDRIKVLDGINAASASSDPSTNVCKAVIDHYRPLADSHFGKDPIEVLMEQKDSALAFGKEGEYLTSEKDFIDWAKNQKPPITLSKHLLDQFGGLEDSELSVIPGSNLYAITNDLVYAPSFTDQTLNGDSDIDSDKKDALVKCTGSDCEKMRQIAFEVAAQVQDDPAKAADHYLSALTSTQRAEFSSIAKNYPAVDKDTDSDNLTDENPMRVPYAIGGRVYVVDLGHISIGWRVYADWSVKIGEMKDGNVVPRAFYAVGMGKGHLLQATSSN